MQYLNHFFNVPCVNIYSALFVKDIGNEWSNFWGDYSNGDLQITVNFTNKWKNYLANTSSELSRAQEKWYMYEQKVLSVIIYEEFDFLNF